MQPADIPLPQLATLGFQLTFLGEDISFLASVFFVLFGFLLHSQQGFQTRALRQRALVYKQLAQSCYLIVDWPGVETQTL